MDLMLKSRLFAGVLLVCTALAGPAPAGAGTAAPDDTASVAAPDGAAPTQDYQSLADVGTALESIRRLPASDRHDAAENLRTALNRIVDKGVEKSDRTSAWLLSGEIHYLLGDYDGAAEAYGKAAKEGKKGPYADEAEAARIQAMEAAGHDEEAAKGWDEWMKHYGKSPLVTEVEIAQAWNAIRRDSLRDAGTMLDALTKSHPWTAKDARVQLAQSTIAYLQKRYDAVTVQTSGSSVDAAIVYLRALTDQAQGKQLEAAAQFQKVAERYPDSRLHDRAMLAKANVYLASDAYKSAAEEFERVAEKATSPDVIAEAKFRHAAAVYLNGDVDNGVAGLREVASTYDGTDVAARAQMLLAEALYHDKRYEEAIVEFNVVLKKYFHHTLAASAQYRVARSLDALGRHAEATSAYQTVVSGYPTSREAPAAAYLAGAGLLQQGNPAAAVRYFQIVLDRYAGNRGEGTIEFATPDRRELVEASLCLLEYAYHQTGNLGMLSGVPHMLLQKMPPSKSPWRAWALLIDADALAAQGRHDEAQGMLEKLIREFPDSPIGVPAHKLLAWTYAQQGNVDLAVQTEDKMLAQYGAGGDGANLASAWFNKANILFNKKQYEAAAGAYEDFLGRFPKHPDRQRALYQAGLCYLRLGRDGDAVDRWEALIKIDPTAEIAEKAWVRAGDVYFQAAHYDDAKRCYQGLLDNFADSHVAAVAMLRIAQCDYNAGKDTEAIDAFSQVTQRFPNHPVAKEARKGIEQALYRLGHGKNGEQVLETLVQKYPTSSFAADAQFEIGLRRYKNKKWPEAAEAFRRVVSQFPGYTDADRAHYLMADAYARAGNDDKATQAYEQFLTFFPKSQYRAEVRLRLGAARFAAKDYMRAAVEFTGVLGDSTSTEVASAALYNLALCRSMLDDADGARSALKEYRKKYPNDERKADIAYQLGFLAEQAGNDSTAAQEYTRAIRANPPTDREVELYYRLGAARERQKDIDGALDAYRKSMHRGKKKSDAYRLSSVARCAAIYEARKDFGKALVAYRDLIKNSSDPQLVVAAKERVSELEANSKR